MKMEGEKRRRLVVGQRWMVVDNRPSDFTAAMTVRKIRKLNIGKKRKKKEKESESLPL